MELKKIGYYDLILITGGKGKLARAFIKELDIHGMDNYFICEGYDFPDLCKFDSRAKILILHFGAKSARDTTVEDAVTFNIAPLMEIKKQLIKHENIRLIFFSAASIMLNEFTSKRGVLADIPNDVYSLSKYVGEAILGDSFLQSRVMVVRLPGVCMIDGPVFITRIVRDLISEKMVNLTNSNRVINSAIRVTDLINFLFKLIDNGKFSSTAVPISLGFSPPARISDIANYAAISLGGRINIADGDGKYLVYELESAKNFGFDAPNYREIVDAEINIQRRDRKARLCC